jgi:uncharacterized protein (TIGR03435 family)
MRVFVLAALCVVPVAAQTPAFEVATLKLSPPPKEDRIVINLGRWQTGRFTMDNVTLSDMMKFGYGLVSGAQLVVPEWTGQVRFDVEAKAPADTKTPELRLMLQTLLDERLHLKLRREQRVLPYLALAKGKSAPKIKAAEMVLNPNVGPQVPGHISHPQMSMQGLATLLSRFERETVVDQTGLAGEYQVSLEWSPENFSAQPDANAPPAERPSLFTAVSEQLGLKLESRRGPLEVLVVESVSREPEAN